MSNSRQKVHDYIEKILLQLEKASEGKILYPYLSVGCGEYYSGMIYCWDHYHMGIRFSRAGKPEYQKYLVDNLISYQTDNGFVPNCISAEGPYPFSSPFHAQPFLMQAAHMYLMETGDNDWAQNRYEKLKRYLSYYEKEMFTPLSLFCWPISWMSGFDNDVVTNFFPPKTVISADINSWIFLEYKAASELAGMLNYHDDCDLFSKKAADLSRQINNILWYDEADSYSAYDLTAQKPLFHYVDEHLENDIGYYSFQTCSNLVPLFAGIPSQIQAKRMIERYVLDEKHFMSQFGIRSLSKSSEYYNNAVWGNPPRFGDPQKLTNSNWQGPVWIPLNYFMFHALNRYGYSSEGMELYNRTNALLSNSLETIGSFAENFNAETGKPLYATEFASWNILADMF